MPTIIQDFFEQITSEIRILKTDNARDQVNKSNKLIKIHCISYDVYNIIIDMDFSNKVEVIKQNKKNL